MICSKYDIPLQQTSVFKVEDIYGALQRLPLGKSMVCGAGDTSVKNAPISTQKI